MARHRIVAEAQSSAPPEAVWRVLVDAENWPSWAPVGSVTVEREAPGDRLGVGMIRRVRSFPLDIREEIVVADAPQHHAYVLLSGLPFDNYRGDVRLTPFEGGTHIRWESTFDGKWPGAVALVKPGLSVAIRKTAKGLARAAERVTAAD